jgi:uncharacterized protein (TIGR03435 family)
MRLALVPVTVGIFASSAFGQSPPATKLAFEVASIRPAAPPQSRADVDMRGTGGPGTDDPGRITFRFVGVLQLLVRAYDVVPWQIQGLPDWANSVAYDIVAKVPPGNTIEQSNVMLQNLLVDRLGLVAHTETKPGEIYELTVAKGGSKLKKPADPSAESSVTSVATAQGRVIIYTNEPVSSLIPSIESGWRHLVVDKTGLTEKYDFSMPLLFPPRAPSASATFDNSSSDADLASVLQRDLGLKLERKKGPVDTLVIDHLEKVPTED